MAHVRASLQTQSVHYRNPCGKLSIACQYQHYTTQTELEAEGSATVHISSEGNTVDLLLQIT